jgi:hypothetical protein
MAIAALGGVSTSVASGLWMLVPQVQIVCKGSPRDLKVLVDLPVPGNQRDEEKCLR